MSVFLMKANPLTLDEMLRLETIRFNPLCLEHQDRLKQMLNDQRLVKNIFSKQPLNSIGL